MSNYAHRGRLVSGGRLQLPAEVRRTLGLADGDEVKMKLVNGEVHVRPARPDWKRIHALVPAHVPESVSMVDELIADRRAEAARDG